MDEFDLLKELNANIKPNKSNKVVSTKSEKDNTVEDLALKTKRIKALEKARIAKSEKKTNQEPAKPIPKPVITNIYGYKYVFLMHQKAARAPEIPMKIGVSNNVSETRNQLQEGNITDFKCAIIIECKNMDGESVLHELRTNLSNKLVHRDWYKLSKQLVEQLQDHYTKKGYSTTTEGRAKLTKVEIKKLTGS